MAAESPYRSGAALLIGIGRYQHEDRIASLQHAPRDARSLARHFLHPDIGAFPNDKVLVLTDKKARRRDVVHHLSKWLPQQARNAEIVVISFAGHGVVHTLGAREEGYLLPYDGDPEDVVTTGIAMSHLAEWIDGIDAEAVVVCLDCCHAGKVVFRDGVTVRALPRERQIRPAVLTALAGKNRFLIASCNEGEQSLEVDALKHGLFTYHLLRGLRGAGDTNRDGRVGVAELFGYVSQAVSTDAKKYGRQQTPWTNAVFTQDVVIARPRRRSGAFKAATAPDFPADQATQEEEQLVVLLRQARRRADPAAIPTIFRCLRHPSPAVHDRARKALHAIGWDKATGAIEELGRQGEESNLGHVFDGLDALVAHADVVRVLDRLVVVLRGDQRTRAVFLLERKRLSLGLERVAELFRERGQSYQFDKVLGAGLFTAAYLARHRLTGLPVVIRVLRPEFAQQPLVRSQFLDLSMRSMRFVHQNLVLTRDVQAFADKDIYYTVRDYVDGVTLRHALESDRKFEPPQILRILRQAVEALTPLHDQNQWHGGVKPSNIFIAKDDRAILGDPSLPIPAAAADLKRLAYDYRYCPPEFFRGAEPGPRADFYALGCVAYELLCGSPPFVSDNPFELIAKHERDAAAAATSQGSALGAAGDRFLRRLLAKDPRDRFADLAELLQALDGLKPVTPVDPTAPAARTAPLMHEASMLELQEAQSLLLLSGAGELDEATAVGTLPAARAERPVAEPPNIPGFEIIEEMGAGGMGVVYKARQRSLDRLVALKLLLHWEFSSPEIQTRFRREARSVAQLVHPNIVQIHDFGDFQGQQFVVLELVEGGTLAEKLKSHPPSPGQAAQMVETLARAVHYAHLRGILHRDLKPANVLLSGDGTLKISDFGLAKQMGEEDTAVTHRGVIMGTPTYMSPEQAVGNLEKISPATDVYALGAILYEMLAARPPFAGKGVSEILALKLSGQEPERLRKLNPDLPAELEGVCGKCLKFEPSQRYPTALELADDLRRFLQKDPAQPEAGGWLQKKLRSWTKPPARDKG